MQSQFHRRRFLENCGWVTAGAAAGLLLPKWFASARRAEADDNAAVDAEQRVRELKLELPALTKPTNTYVPTVRVGEYLYVSGMGPRRADGSPWMGKVGRDMELEEAQAAARDVGLRVLATVRDSLGSLNRVVRLVKTLGMVNATPDYAQQPQVINGFSDLMVEVFGPERGKGTRSAVGMGSLPGGIPVEVEVIFQVRT
jgi:enamine deaminase RidA (YjgF/YER057c/UK114 family)